jgi:hypothetical protein
VVCCACVRDVGLAVLATGLAIRLSHGNGWNFSASGMSAVGYLAWMVMMSAVLICCFPRTTESPNFSTKGCLVVAHDSSFSYWWDELLPNQYYGEVLLRARRMEFRPRHF